MMDREARIRERVRDLLDEIVSVELHPINYDPYPGTVGEVADEIARHVLELEASGIARGLSGMIRERITDPVAHGIERGHLDVDEIKRITGAPELEARRLSASEFAERIYRMGRAE